MRTFAVQYLEPGPSVDSYSPDLVREKLQFVCDILPISIIILGWNIPEQLVEICRREADRVHAMLYRWQPLLTSDGEFPVKGEYRVIGLGGKPIAGHLNMPEFTFMCPNNPQLRKGLLAHLEVVIKRGIYKGVFLDRMRFPSLSGDPEHNLGCFCRYCREKAAANGFDLLEVQRQIRQMLRSGGGIKDFLRSILRAEDDQFFKPEIALLRKFLNFRSDSITDIVHEAAEIAHSHSWEVGLDCFSPSLANSVGQNFNALDKTGDWVKPMTYLHTFAPAGLPFELNGLIELLVKGGRVDIKGATRWLSRIAEIPIPEDQEKMIREGLPELALKSETLKAETTLSKPLLAGIELAEIEMITCIKPLQLVEDMRQLKQTDADGVVLSWDLWHIQGESIRILARTLLAG